MAIVTAKSPLLLCVHIGKTGINRIYNPIIQKNMQFCKE